MPLLCKGPRSGPFAQQRTTTALACFYSATLAWNATAVDTVPIQLGNPVVSTRLRDRRIAALGMGMPEAPVDADDLAASSEHDVG